MRRELLARAWAAGAGPGAHHSPSTLIRRSARPTAWPRRAPTTARGAAHFLRETVNRVRYAGASGQLTVRADSGFYAPAYRLVQSLPLRRQGNCWLPSATWTCPAGSVSWTTSTSCSSTPSGTAWTGWTPISGKWRNWTHAQERPRQRTALVEGLGTAMNYPLPAGRFGCSASTVGRVLQQT